MLKLDMFGKVAFLLLVVGGVNWGLVGFFNFDVIQFLLHSMPMLQKVVYILVGVSAVYLVFVHFKHHE